MRLSAGTRLGPFEIVCPLGAGGMGEVYKARDTRLDRAVAIKVLHAGLSSFDARDRFEREAKAISQLSHPHICALYDVGHVTLAEPPAGQRDLRTANAGADADTATPETIEFLVMELVEGETLADRLVKGALSTAQTLRYGAEIADALDTAHRRGIVHRDLKPANVMLTTSGVKLLDFGLAKAAAPMFGGAAVSVAQTQAAIPALSQEGVIAGTLQYMSPEQIEARAVDARSDIFALGVVLYEMATGKKAFTAKSSVGVASAILHDDAPPMMSTNTPTPLALERIVAGCIAKNPDDRWQSAHDVRMQLRAGVDTETVEAKAGGRPGRGRWVPWTVAAAAIGIAGLMAVVRPSRVSPRVGTPVRFSLPPPSGGAFYLNYENTGLSISPDGSRIAFSARDASGVYRIWMRAIADLTATPLAGTDGATSLFWSPDGHSLAYFAAAKLRRIDLPGGTPVSICEVREGIGFSGTWGADGQILFSSVEGETIFSVAATGGVATARMTPDPAREEARLNWPLFLPGGRRFLYLLRRRDGSGHLMLADSGKGSREVMPLQSSVQYVEPGYLVFAGEGALLGQRFDLARGEVVGAPFSIAAAVSYFLTTSVARFAASLNGALVYQSHDEEQRLAWFDRSGREAGAIGGRGQYKGPRISPDERRVVFDRLSAGAFDVWETDLERGVDTQLTFGASSEGAGPWSPDGRSLFFNADRGAPPQIFRKNLTTGSEDLVVPPSGTFQEPQDVSPDGKTLLFTQRSAGGDHIWIFALDRSAKPSAAFDTPFEQEGVRFSRDGRAFSYFSAPSGRPEIYVSPFPPTGERIPVSTSGAFAARWSRNGKELFYLSADRRMMTVPIQTSPSLHVGTPAPLFELDPKRPWLAFDVASSGRFLAVVAETRANEQPLTVVLNWTAALAR